MNVHWNCMRWNEASKHSAQTIKAVHKNEGKQKRVRFTYFSDIENEVNIC